MKTLNMYKDFMDKHIEHYPYINIRMKELSELVNDVLNREHDKTAKFEYEIDNGSLEITLVVDKNHEIKGDIPSKTLTILFDIDTMIIGTYLGHEEDYKVQSVEEGMDLIEKKIYSTLGISEGKYN